MTKNKELSQKWTMWLIAVSFFAFQFILRIFPGLVVPELMAQFKVSATEFGLLSAAYYFGYSGMQIPVGFLLDRYNPRYVISFCAFICALGTLSFVYSKFWGITIVGRFLIGVGSAAGFLGTAKVIRQAFKPEKFTSMVGLSFTVGLLGALYGGKPTSLLIADWGWVSVMQVLALVCFLISGLVFLLFPNQTEPKAPKAETPALWTSLKELIKTPGILWLAIAGALMVGPLEGFADLWGVPYLVNVRGFSRNEASLITSLIYFGMLFGGPVLSFLAKKLKSLYGVTAFCGFGMAGVFLFVLFYSGTISQPALMALMVFIGVLCCYQVTVFGIASQLAPPHLSGLATSFTNCINMSTGSLFHFLMGLLMDWQWTGQMENGVRVYSSESYVTAISIIPAFLVLGFIGFLLMPKRK